HVRIYCDSADVRLGCEEIGPIRRFKKAYKYRGLLRAARGADLVPRRGEAGRGRVGAALPTLPPRGVVPRRGSGRRRARARAARAADLVPRRGEAGRGMVMAALPTLPLRGFVPR